jgi:hypothetical protein
MCRPAFARLDALLFAVVFCACGGQDQGSSSGGSGGAGKGGAGGSSASGGAVASGGNGLGGTMATGGQSGVTSTGGNKGSGGVGTGGLSASGGAALGGAVGSGGAASGGAGSTGGGAGAAGARTGGAVGSGGTVASGGVSAGGARSGGATGGGGASVAGSGGSGTGGAAVGGVGSGGTTAAGGTTGAGGATASKTYYVSPKGKSSNDGTSFASALDFATALASVKASELILLEAGTYTIAASSGAKNTITFSKSGSDGKTIRVESYDNGRAVFDFSFGDQDWVQDSYGFLVSGSYWSFKGIDITRAGYQGAYVTGQHNTFENCTFHHNRNSGLEINEGGGYTTVINCDAYRNYDIKKNGSMSDGFAPKQTQGPGNKLIGCRSWENGDDGYDCYDSPETVTFENCWAFRNGVDVWNYGSFAGNGNGFKVGGNSKLANHKLTNCVAWGQPGKGFDQNNNTGGITIYNSTGYKNGINFGLGGTLASGQKHDFKNNISLAGSSSDSIGTATSTTNSWNTGLAAAASDFVSVDTNLSTVARNPDGSLPATDLFRLVKGSKLIDAGTKVGLPYAGSAPDLGAFETSP